MIALHPSENPVVSILVLSYDNLEMLGDCLGSIARSIDPARVPYETIVLFQQMSLASVESFTRDVDGITALSVRLNLGFAAGNNYAAKHARGRYLVFLNDDAIAQRGWLEALVQTVESDERIGAVGSRICFPDGTLQEAGTIVWSDGSCYPLGRGDAPGALTYAYARPVDYASANGMLIRRSTFDAAGGFDERYFPGYYEDVDLCMTIRHRLGRRVVYEPRSVLMHHESATARRDPAFRDFLFRRHKAIFADKWSVELKTYPAPSPESPSAVESAVLAARGNPQRVLVVDDRIPDAGMGSGFGRSAEMLAELDAAGFAISFHPSNRGVRPVENGLSGLGVDLVLSPIEEHLARSARGYDAAIVSRPHNFRAFHAAMRAAAPKTAIVYDAEALYHRRLRLQADLESDPERRRRLEAQAVDMEALEAAIARSSDLVVTISEDERNWLESIEGHAPIAFMRPLASGIESGPPSPGGRSGAVFVAGWLAGDGSPNVAAIEWYAREVVPLVRRTLPSFVTYVTGSNPPLRVQSLAGDAIVLLGFVESIDRAYAGSRIAISPMLAGAGVKIKTIEAMQYGVPVVATTVGAEGLGLYDRSEIDVTDDPADFAARIVELATDDGYWMSRRESAAARIARWESERTSWAGIVHRVLNDNLRGDTAVTS